MWNADCLGADPSKIGAKRSHTVVAELLELPKRARRLQRITGPPGEEAEQIVQKTREAQAS